MKYQLYLSGPMSGVKDFNHPAFNAAAAELRRAGYTVFSPVDNGVPQKSAWGTHMRADVAKMMECQHVATLPGWSSSKGATIEVRLARGLGMQVMKVGQWVGKKNEVIL